MNNAQAPAPKNNKKKYIWIGIGVLLLIALCFGGNEEPAPERAEQILKAAQTEIKGDLKGCYEVVDRNYKVKFSTTSYGYDFVNVELKRTDKKLPYDRKDVVIYPEAEESSAHYCAGFGIEVLDADGEVLCKTSANATPYSWDEMTAALQLLPEETSTIGFNFERIPKNAASFRVTSLVQKNDERKTEAAAAAATTKTTSEPKKEKKEMSEKSLLEEAADDTKAMLKVADEALELTGKMLELLDE